MALHYFKVERRARGRVRVSRYVVMDGKARREEELPEAWYRRTVPWPGGKALWLVVGDGHPTRVGPFRREFLLERARGMLADAVRGNGVDRGRAVELVAEIEGGR